MTFLSKQGLIFRFKFLMLITLACAAMTVIFFIVSQVRDGSGLPGRESSSRRFLAAPDAGSSLVRQDWPVLSPFDNKLLLKKLFSFL